MTEARLFVIVGGTGTQGGATARRMLDAGRRVRILTRNADGAVAQALQARGAELAVGDLDDAESLGAAMRGAYGVFSVQRPDMDESDSERRHGLALIAASKTAGVNHIVHSSVCQAGQHESFARWDEGYWSTSYWCDKWAVEEAVRGAGLERWTILRPSFIMENFRSGKAKFLYPQLHDGTLLTPVESGSKLQMIAGDDIGAFAAAAFDHPERFDRKTIELVGDTLTMDGIADVLATKLDKRVTHETVAPETAIAAGIGAKWVRSQEWINDVGYHADTSELGAYGVSLTRFEQWVERNADDIVIDG